MGLIFAIATTPNFSVQPIQSDITYQVQKFEGKGEKGTFEVKFSGLSKDNAMLIGGLESTAALKYAATSPANAEQQLGQGGTAASADTATAAANTTPTAATVGTAHTANEQVAEKSVESVPPVVMAGLPTTQAPTLPTTEASFDCAKASSKIEKLICSTPETANADKRLAAVYSVARAKSGDDAQIKADQRDWMKSERNACNDSACLLKVTENRIQQLGTTIH